MLFKGGMTKLLALVIVGIMLIQIIKPIGWPGLKRRSDFWKLALISMGAIALAAVLGHLT